MGMGPYVVLDAKGKERPMTDAEIRAATGIDCSGDEIRTKQEGKDDADINVIVARCLKAGVSPAELGGRVGPVFGDATQIPDYRESLHRILAVQDAFMLLPATTRAKFDNDPVKAVEFAKDPLNLEQCLALGLLQKKATPPEPPAPVPAAVPPAVPPK